MRTRSRIAAAAAAGVVATGLVVGPAAWSAVDSMNRGFVSAEDRPGNGWGGGHMRDGGAMGPMMQGGRGGAGHCDGTFGGTAARGTLSTGQEEMLAAQAEREKLSHDLYVALADSTGDPRFDHIARAETMHLSAIRSLLQRYGIDDPTEGLGAGEFAGDDAAAAYDDYLARGSGSLTDALTVAEEVERADILALREAADDIEAPDVDQALSHLLRSSQMHLAWFDR